MFKRMLLLLIVCLNGWGQSAVASRDSRKKMDFEKYPFKLYSSREVTSEFFKKLDTINNIMLNVSIMDGQIVDFRILKTMYGTPEDWRDVVAWCIKQLNHGDRIVRNKGIKLNKTIILVIERGEFVFFV